MVVTVAHDTLAAMADGVGEIDDGPFLISEAARRLACDSTVVAMSLGDGGEPLSVGRATPTIPRHIRRALRKREGAAGSRAATSAASSTATTSSTGPRAARRRWPIRACCAGITITPCTRAASGCGARPPASWSSPPRPASSSQPPPRSSRSRSNVDDVNRRLGVVIGTGTGACLWGGERLDMGLTVDALLCLEGRIGA